VSTNFTIQVESQFVVLQQPDPLFCQTLALPIHNQQQTQLRHLVQPIIYKPSAKQWYCKQTEATMILQMETCLEFSSVDINSSSMS
jgi:hypothetical protein